MKKKNYKISLRESFYDDTFSYFNLESYDSEALYEGEIEMEHLLEDYHIEDFDISELSDNIDDEISLIWFLILFRRKNFMRTFLGYEGQYDIYDSGRIILRIADEVGKFNGNIKNITNAKNIGNEADRNGVLHLLQVMRLYKTILQK